MPKSKKKSTKGIMTMRINDIVPLVSFLSRAEIIGYVAKKANDPKKQYWHTKVTESQIDNYIKKAKEVLKVNWGEARKEAIERSYNNVNNLYKKAFQDGDYRTCLAIQEKIDKLAGINEKEEVKTTNVITFGSSDNLKSIIDSQNKEQEND